MRTIEWEPQQTAVRLIDQRWLPARTEFVACYSAEDVAEAIRNMTVRGAPAIGVSAAYGLALAGLRSAANDPWAWLLDVQQAAQLLKAARPTAVNLAWAVDRVLVNLGTPETVVAGQERLLQLAHAMAAEDVAVNERISQFGAELIEDGDTIIHHCNTGALATVDWGTALGVIRMAHESGKRIHVLVDETRPRLQGARLTAWELQQYGIPYEIISDNMAGYFLQSGQAQKVLFGADRVARNGDVANKIGSYMLALSAHDNNVPVYSVFPTSTVDLSIQSGAEIPIEQRDPAEVLDIQINCERVTPEGARACNPAFDVTPNRLLTGLITENGVIYPPFEINLPGSIKP